MKSYRQFINENVTKNFLQSKGYTDPKTGDDGHVTYTKSKGDQILVDIPAGEWHHMINGVVKKVGSNSDKSIEKYLD